MSFYYISNPYSGSEEQREERARIAAEVCGKLLRRDIHAWSPAVHSHAIMKVAPFTADERRSLVLEFGPSLLRKARMMIVLEIDGWESSFGVQSEIQLCQELDIPVKYLSPSELTDCADPKVIFKDEPTKIYSGKKYESDFGRVEIPGTSAHAS